MSRPCYGPITVRSRSCSRLVTRQSHAGKRRSPYTFVVVVAVVVAVALVVALVAAAAAAAAAVVESVENQLGGLLFAQKQISVMPRVIVPSSRSSSPSHHHCSIVYARHCSPSHRFRPVVIVMALSSSLVIAP